MNRVNILIVEDEKIESNAIASLLSAELNEYIHSLLCVNNGETALEVCKTNHIQLIISDINIPKMNGLEMLKKVKAINPAVKCIILTGYDYFEYAQEAIHIGVDDFLLKPLSPKELHKSVKNVIMNLSDEERGRIMSRKYKEFQDLLGTDLVYAIISNAPVKQIAQYMDIFHEPMMSMCCICLEYEAAGSSYVHTCLNQIEKKYHILYETYFENLIVFVFTHHVMTESELQDLKNIFGSSFNVGCSSVKTVLADYASSYTEAMKDIKHLSDTLSNENGQTHKIIQGIVWEMIGKIQLMQPSVCNEAASMLCTTFANRNRYQFLSIITEFFDLLEEKLRLTFQDESLSFSYNSSELNDLALMKDMQTYITAVMKKTIDPLLSLRNKKMNRLIKKAYEYIEKNYQYPIGLNDLADYLQVTPQYISALLSNQAHNNFTNILTEYRIEKAKKMLLGDKKIKEIAFLVGFQNQNYFAKTFKKVTGMTPKEFKLHHS